ncbi:hypothetical protein PVAND_015895 [Polypedilum vanderplanki]|uniref:Uncharacterized protein n=1 Tax=Polypedilum vanderplanki TaxID=319348 RepID=A0A9J6BDZ4_POLVA|nr:hypothetical protein PVAND_015895 [Polypedilum vanderplanki]
MKNFKLFLLLAIISSSRAFEDLVSDNQPQIFYDDVPVNCNFKTIAATELWTVVTEEFYACDLKTNFTSAIATISSISGNHMDATKDHESVEFLLISRIVINLFPSNFEKFFTNLIGIKIDNVGLSSITQNDLKTFPNLKYLGMTDTILSVIISGTFSKNPNLELVDLRMNAILFIDSAVFDTLTNLKFLYLENVLCLIGENPETSNVENDPTKLNDLKLKIASKCVSSNALQSFIARFIRDFAQAARAIENCENSCQENCITDCSDFCDAREEEIRQELNSTIDSLNECQENFENATTELTEVKDKISQLEFELDDCKNPNNDTCRFKEDSEIYLYSCVANNVDLNDGNSTIEWTGKHLKDKENKDVNSLIIQRQKISFIPKNLLNVFESLKILVIEESGLEKIGKNDLSDLTALEVLKITKNNLTAIEGGAFDGLTKLLTLNLAENNLNSLPTKIFDKMTALKVLDLSWNKLTNIRYDVISSVNKIDRFIVIGNSITVVDINLIWRLQKASIIDLSETGCDEKFDKIENPGSSFINFYTMLLNNC